MTKRNNSESDLSKKLKKETMSMEETKKDDSEPSKLTPQDSRQPDEEELDQETKTDSKTQAIQQTITSYFKSIKPFTLKKSSSSNASVSFCT